MAYAVVMSLPPRVDSNRQLDVGEEEFLEETLEESSAPSSMSPQDKHKDAPIKSAGRTSPSLPAFQAVDIRARLFVSCA